MKTKAVWLAAAVLLVCYVLPSSAAPRKDQFLAWHGSDQIDGYAHIDQVFVTLPIARGSTVLPLSSAPTTLGVDYHYAQESGTVDDFIARNRVAGLLVVSHGKIVLERYALGQTAQTRWVSFSIAKSITSTLIGAAIKDGKIKSVRDKLTQYIPELQGTVYDGVSIAQLMEMRSGVQWNEDYEDPNSDAWWLVHEFADDRADLLAHLAAKHRVAPAGTVFNYNTGETNLAGILVARAIGVPISRYLSEKIWSKAGMESDAYWLTTGGSEVGGCCISIPLRDYARFALFFMHGAKVDGRSILPTHWIQDATSRHTEKVFDHFGYGYFWWVRTDRSYEAIGIFGQSIFIDPASDLVVVTLSAWPRAGWQEGYERQAAFLEAVQASLPH